MLLPSLLAARAYIGSGGTLVPKKREKAKKESWVGLTCWHLFREDVRTFGVNSFRKRMAEDERVHKKKKQQQTNPLDILEIYFSSYRGGRRRAA